MAAVALAAIVALTHWAVRQRTLASNGWWPRFVRSWSDPFVNRVERNVLRRGGNPQDAPLWLAGGTLIAGLLLIVLVRWIMGSVLMLSGMGSATAVDWLRLLISAGTSFLMAAILIRVVGLWLGVGRYTKWMRPFYTATDWIIRPIERRLPTIGPIDLSPVAAYFALWVLRTLLLGALS